MQEERIRRAQNAFNRERNKHNRGFESWKEHAPNQHDTSYRESGNYALSHHYSVLGLDRYRKAPYSNDEIKVTLFIVLVNSILIIMYY